MSQLQTMATLQQPDPPSTEQANTKGGNDDSTRIQAHIYSPAAKASTDLDFAQHLERCIDASAKGQGSRANRAGALSYLESLSATRRQLLELLARPSSDVDGEVASGLSQYAGLLLGLINIDGALSGQIAGQPWLLLCSACKIRRLSVIALSQSPLCPHFCIRHAPAISRMTRAHQHG